MPCPAGHPPRTAKAETSRSLTRVTTADAPVDLAPRRKPPIWVLPTGLITFTAVLVCGWVANSVWANWQDTHPLALIVLSPINRHLILTANQLGLGEFLGFGLVRHLIPDPAFYAVGYWFGARALLWISEGNAFATRLVGEDGRGLENPSHRRFLYPLAFIMPNNWVSLFCGAARIPLHMFITVNVLGTLTRLMLCRWVASAFADQVESLSNWISDYQLPITIISIIGVLIAMTVQLRPQGALRQMSRLDDDTP